MAEICYNEISANGVCESVKYDWSATITALHKLVKLAIIRKVKQSFVVVTNYRLRTR